MPKCAVRGVRTMNGSSKVLEFAYKTIDGVDDVGWLVGCSQDEWLVVWGFCSLDLYEFDFVVILFDYY